jgi:hypothetical protein
MPLRVHKTKIVASSRAAGFGTLQFNLAFG